MWGCGGNEEGTNCDGVGCFGGHCVRSRHANGAPYTKAPYYEAQIYGWTGFYIGAMGGYGWSDQVRASIGGISVSASSNDLQGGFGGGTLGYNWQMGSWVMGLEADGAWSDLKNSETAFGVTLGDKVEVVRNCDRPDRLSAGKFGPALFQGRLRVGGKRNIGDGFWSDVC